MNLAKVKDVYDLYGSSHAYGLEELEIVAKAILNFVPDGGTIVEIGSQFGVSAALFLTMAKEHDYRVYCIDPFTFELSGEQDVGPRFMRAMLTLKSPFATLAMTSAQALERGFIPRVFEVVHIDGDHSKAGVTLDCDLYLPKLIPGGVAIFHDYGRCGTPDVQPVVDSFTEGWEVLAKDGLKVAIKPKTRLI